jgi:hypothetical protein
MRNNAVVLTGICLAASVAFAQGNNSENQNRIFAAKRSAILAKRGLQRGGGGTVGIQASNGMTVTTATAAQLANALLGAGVTLSGTPTLTGAATQAGTFTGGPGLIGFSSGIILTSGLASAAATTYAGADLPDNNAGTAGDAGLSALIGGTATHDASILSFSFVPTSSTIFFTYTFASAEYPNFVGSQFNDVFGFFVNGTNRAVLPGTSTVVSINNVNATTNSGFFNKYNAAGDQLPYGGETKTLQFSAPVNTGVVNNIVLGIADASDSALDSAVFIQAGTLSTNPGTPTTPIPPSIFLMLTALVAAALYLVYRQRRAQA